MPLTRALTIVAGAVLLLALDVATRRGRYYSPQARPVRVALYGGVALALAWVAAAYFGGAGLAQDRWLEAALLGVTWFVLAAMVGVLLRRAAVRRGRRAGSEHKS